LISTKQIALEIEKPENYGPIPIEERERIANKIITETFKLAERFDGFCRVTVEIKIEEKGNA